MGGGQIVVGMGCRKGQEGWGDGGGEGGVEGGGERL